MATRFSRFRAVGAALAVSLLIAACGGGGGGGTEPPPPPPTDTTPPTVKSWMPPDGTKDIDTDGKIVISVTMDEAFNCPAKNPITITKGNGDEVKGGEPACDPATKTLSLTFATKALFRCETYTVTLPKGTVKDLAGNALANDSKIVLETKCPARTAMIVTANAVGGGRDDWANAFSGIDLSTGQVREDWSVVESDSSEVVSSPWALAADPAMGLMYGADFGGFRGVNVIDMATGAVSNVELNPGDHTTTEEVSGVVMKDGCIWAAYSGIQQAYDPDFRNRLYCIDRQTRTITSHTDAVTSTEMATMWLVAHPDPAVHRLYAFNVAISGWNVGLNCELNLCQVVYLPGTRGTVTEIDSQTGAILRTFVVGSQPLKGVVDRARNRLYVVNTGDESVSIVNLDTGTVGTVPLPEFGYKRQPMDVALMDGKLWVSDDRDSVWVYDSSMALVGTVVLDSMSGPESMTVLDGKLYVSLQSGYSKAVAEVNADLSVNRQFVVTAHPGAITSYVSGQ